MPVQMRQMGRIAQIRLVSSLRSMIAGTHQDDFHVSFQHVLHWNPIRSRAFHGYAGAAFLDQPHFQGLQCRHGRAIHPCLHLSFFVGRTRDEGCCQHLFADVDRSASLSYCRDLNHRFGLSDGVLIKNNHIALAGGIKVALERAHRNRRGTQPLEVEVRNLSELEDALAYGAEAILLDNMPVADVKTAVERCSKADRRIPLECSGGISLDNVRAYAETGVDFISVGALTHSAPAVDLSLRIAPA